MDDESGHGPIGVCAERLEYDEEGNFRKRVVHTMPISRRDVLVADTGTTVSGAAGIKELLRIKRGDNDSCVWQGERSSTLKRGNWNCTVFSSFKLTSTPDALFIEETVRALEGEHVFFERENKATVPRDLM